MKNSGLTVFLPEFQSRARWSTVSLFNGRLIFASNRHNDQTGVAQKLSAHESQEDKMGEFFGAVSLIHFKSLTGRFVAAWSHEITAH